MQAEDTLPLFQVLVEEYNAQHPEDEHHYKGAEKGLQDYHRLNPEDEEQRNKINSDEVKKFYRWLHNKEINNKPLKRSALCFSGGGIRSATFGLGILQGLARQGLLGEFDYLSTVSGGGYLGSWLSAWIHRKGLKKVQKRLANEMPPSPLGPEPDPIVHLRSYSNYMSPKLGLLSGDTWTLVGIFMRNLILNWLVLLPPILLVLMIPRFSLAVINFDLSGTAALALTLLPGILLGVIAIAYIYANRPSLADTNLRDAAAGSVFPNDKKSQGWFLLLCLLPVLLLAVFSTTCYAWLRTDPGDLLPWFIGFGITLNVGGLIGSFRWRKEFDTLRIIWEFVIALLIGGLGGLLAWLVAHKIFFSPLENIQSMALYICFAAPAFLAVFLLAATIFVGLTSRFTTDADREWVARAGAWILLASLIWVVVSVIVMFGPVLLVYGTKTILASLSVGSISGIVTLLLGYSSKTPVRGGASSRAKSNLLTIAAPLFAVFILISMSLGNSWLIVELSSSADSPSDLGTYQGLLEVIYHSPLATLFEIVAAFLAIGLIASAFINANKFSLHGAYRDRLIRAYLGGSRVEAERKPNPFTGLDENDNLQMHELRTQLFHDENVDTARLVALLESASDKVAAQLKQRLSKKSIDLLADHKAGLPVDGETLQYSLLDDLNRIIRGSSLAGTRSTSRMDEIECLRLNRDFLQELYRDVFKPNPIPKPLHIINVTLNLVGGKKLAWQNRKAESFSISPLHSGSDRVGYRDSRVYGLNKNKQAISLGTAAAISGAAVSPNMGYYSSAFVTFLLALFNLRLGWWLGNPGPAGNGKWRFGKRRLSTYDTAGPNFAARPIFAETLGLTDDKHPYVYLSDGGHFENLGLYEMVLRRCKMIVVSDGSADPDFGLEGLGNAISRIRVDLGVPIDIKRIFMLPRDQDEDKRGYGEINKKFEEKYCAIGTIRYSRVDRTGVKDKDEDYDGSLIYIKAFLSGTEPVDVYNYAKTHLSFPHESTADQMYSESQFESYRELGSHMIDMICAGMQSAPPHDLPYFFDFVRAAFTPIGMGRCKC